MSHVEGYLKSGPGIEYLDFYPLAGFKDEKASMMSSWKIYVCLHSPLVNHPIGSVNRPVPLVGRRLCLELPTVLS